MKSSKNSQFINLHSAIQRAAINLRLIVFGQKLGSILFVAYICLTYRGEIASIATLFEIFFNLQIQKRLVIETII